MVYQAMWLDHKDRLDRKAMLVILVQQAHLDQVEQADQVVYQAMWLDHKVRKEDKAHKVQ